MTSFYEFNLALLTGFCLLSLLIDRQISKRKTPLTQRTSPDHVEKGKLGGVTSVAALAKQYLIVYAIVMGADWLQGPYVYSLYREQYDFPERIVAILFVIGFLSGGLTAPLVGVWADQYGRKYMCLAFCLSYTCACLCILVPWLPVLLVGRVLGGVSTSILFSAFESWLISSSTAMSISQSDLSKIMGRATLVNGFVATSAGIVSNELVKVSRTFSSPFIASGGLLILAWGVIRNTWHENYGGGGHESTDIFQLKRLGHAWQIVKNDPLLITLGLTQTCFEGSMYLFVFLWVPSLQEASPTYPAVALPLGYIFSSFMISMMLGSLLYTAIVSYSLPTTPSSPADSSLTLHAKLSSIVCAVSALALAASVSYFDERTRFWAFCAFEACVGMYYPVQGMLRGTLIADEHRATLSALFRVPLNIFVVVSLLTGVSSARMAVLTASSVMLTLASLMTAFIIVNRSDKPTVVNMNGNHARP